MPGIQLGRRNLTVARLASRDRTSFALRSVGVEVVMDGGRRRLRTYGVNRHAMVRVTTTPPEPEKDDGHVPIAELFLLPLDDAELIASVLPPERYMTLSWDEEGGEYVAELADAPARRGLKIKGFREDGKYTDADKLLDVNTPPLTRVVFDARNLMEVCETVIDFCGTAKDEACPMLLDTRQPDEAVIFKAKDGLGEVYYESGTGPEDDIIEGCLMPMTMDYEPWMGLEVARPIVESLIGSLNTIAAEADKEFPNAGIIENVALAAISNAKAATRTPGPEGAAE